MRDIKFRVWDKEEKKFFEPIYEAYKGNLLDLSITLSGELLQRTINEPALHESRFPDRYIIMRYTGKKDKNKKEIYEGDIINAEYGIGTVTFDEVTCQFKYVFALDSDALWYYTNDAEVIGNIYETKQ